jgi:hypothetical protein
MPLAPGSATSSKRRTGTAAPENAGRLQRSTRRSQPSSVITMNGSSGRTFCPLPPRHIRRPDLFPLRVVRVHHSGRTLDATDRPAGPSPATPSGSSATRFCFLPLAAVPPGARQAARIPRQHALPTATTADVAQLDRRRSASGVPANAAPPGRSSCPAATGDAAPEADDSARSWPRI